MESAAMSFPRKRESSGKERYGRQVWIPACAGMTILAAPPNRVTI
jgi:hypothetical protein